ncbi:NlpC/P60 family protein [Lacticaseibacillus hulanensis]|uniref:NlpC/P60 family protein n=1 Tax=Lacticaseibacillus hulanensis TaxID=2493111 RepID=UPI000FD7FD43|nr:NlpC/P60 family protein [Lacticaseibacillus hulanensis]
MKETRKQVRLNRDESRRVKLFKTHKGWMTMGVTTLAMAAGVITLGSNASDVSAATWKTRSVSEIADQIKTATDKTTYTIKWGDTLGTIAQALKDTGINTTAERLAEINHIAKADLIYAGNKLTFTGTGSTAVATVKESDGKTASYNLDPNKSTKATKTDVAEAKKSQASAASSSNATKATTTTSSKATTTTTTVAAKKAKLSATVKELGATVAVKTAADGSSKLVVTIPAKASDATKSAIQAAVTASGLDDSAVTLVKVADLTANESFEAAIKAKGYTFTKDAGSKYSFEVGNASAGDIEAITSVLNYYGVTNYQFTENGVPTDEDADATSADTDTADDTDADAADTDSTDTTTTTTTEDDDDVAPATTTKTDEDSSSAATSSSAPAATKTATTASSSSSSSEATAPKATTPAPAVKKTTPAATPAPKKTVAKKVTPKVAPVVKKTTTTSSASRAAKVAAVIKTARQQLGKPYEYGAKGPSSFDCSGFVSYVFKNAIGMDMSGNSRTQSYKGSQVSLGSLQTGDLIFWSSNGSNSGVYHVAIYIGGGQYIVAPHTGSDVQIQTISSYFKPSFAKRVL